MLPQLLANGIVTGAAYALVALGFALIYYTTRVFHFAHGAVYTLSAYLFYSFLNLCGLPSFLSWILTLISIAAVGIIIDEIVYSPLVERRTSTLVPMISSLGLYIVIVNSIAMFYGNETKIITPGVQDTYTIGVIILTKSQILTLMISIICIAATFIFMNTTGLGKTIRAMRDDAELLSVSGINPRMVRMAVFSAGSALAGISAILTGMDVGFDPQIGTLAVLNAAVAVIIGGIGIFEGAIVGALLLGIIQSLTVWVASARWQETITFAVLILFLIFRPDGLIGRRRRVEEAAD